MAVTAAITTPEKYTIIATASGSQVSTIRLDFHVTGEETWRVRLILWIYGENTAGYRIRVDGGESPIICLDQAYDGVVEECVTDIPAAIVGKNNIRIEVESGVASISINNQNIGSMYSDDFNSVNSVTITADGEVCPDCPVTLRVVGKVSAGVWSVLGISAGALVIGTFAAIAAK